MKNFRLINELNYDVARHVGDMAAFFDCKLAEPVEFTLKITLKDKKIIAYILTNDKTYTSFCQAENVNISGELGRCVKVAVVLVLEEYTEQKVKLPWGILTGVRPDKLVHKIMDSGINYEDIPTLLQKKYLLPPKQGNLLARITQRQKEILPDSTRLNDAAIYIGIPYCPSRCSYCSFPSGIVPKDEESQQNFIKLIEQDIKNVVQLLSMHNLNVISLYIGGGTPTSLSDKVFADFLNIVRKNLLLPSISEFTVEAGRPDCFSSSKLAAMEDAGVTRVSVNPQTFHNKTLQLIGRKHSVEDFYNAYALVRKSTIPIVNMDLIIGLPEENWQDIMYNLQEAVSLAPENLTIHTLTLKKSAPLFGAYKGLAAEEAENLVAQGQKMAALAGLEPYYLYRQHYMLGHLANIGYAKPQTESVYNIQMMEERHPIIGIGPSSASKRPLADGHHISKLNMPKNISVYAADLTILGQKRADLFK